MKIIETYGRINLVEKKAENTAAELKAALPGRKICVCDFYVSGCEQGVLTAEKAITFDGLLIIDHHAPLPAMMQRVSSTSFAVGYVTKHGPLDDDYTIVINHPDADSILAALVMSGKLEPRAEYAKAAEAADHTGDENVLADVLQALEDDRSLQKSVDLAQKIADQRVRARRELEEQKAEFKWDGAVAYKVVKGKIDAGFLPALFPDAVAVAVAWPMPLGSRAKWGIKVRLGLPAAGIALNKLGLPDAGGRWNAISTTRNGGTDVPLEEYVALVRAGIENVKS